MAEITATLTDDERIARLTELGRRVWPHVQRIGQRRVHG